MCMTHISLIVFICVYIWILESKPVYAKLPPGSRAGVLYSQTDFRAIHALPLLINNANMSLKAFFV